MPLLGKVDRFCDFDHKHRLTEMLHVAMYDYDEGTGQHVQRWQKPADAPPDPMPW